MLLQVLKKLLRDDVVARARIIVNEVWFSLLQQEQPELYNECIARLLHSFFKLHNLQTHTDVILLATPPCWLNLKQL
jgi:hypothetical protein